MLSSKIKYESKLISDSKCYTNVFSCLCSLPNSPLSVTLNGSHSVLPHDRISMFNNYFHSFYHQSSLPILDTFSSPSPLSNLPQNYLLRAHFSLLLIHLRLTVVIVLVLKSLKLVHLPFCSYCPIFSSVVFLVAESHWKGKYI